MATYIFANSVQLKNDTFSNNTDITSVDLAYVPFYANSMFNAFYHCDNLISVSNINENVTSMRWTFVGCSNLVNVPTIPDSVTDMYETFINCTKLVDAPIIGNSVSNMSMSFYNCRNLVNAPIIPNNVISLLSTFNRCTNLTGNIYIQSENVNGVGYQSGVVDTRIFGSTTLQKNVYIPYKYINNVYTKTYNSFISAGYDENGTLHGVYLKDLNQL